MVANWVFAFPVEACFLLGAGNRNFDNGGNYPLILSWSTDIWLWPEPCFLSNRKLGSQGFAELQRAQRRFPFLSG